MKFKHKQKVIDGETWIKFNSKFERRRYFYSNLWIFILILLIVVLGAILFSYVDSHIELLQSTPCQICEEKMGLICFNPSK